MNMSLGGISSYNVTAVISRVKYPLMIVIVMIHLFQDAESLSIHGQQVFEGYPNWFFDFLYYMAEAFGRFAVPVFFAISGYLFFYHVERLDKVTYFSKLKKRARSLLVPYLIWNSMYIFLFLLHRTPLMAGLYPSASSVNIDWTWVANAYWGIDGYPLLYPLWYIRDLMIIVVLCPVVWFFIQKAKALWLGGLLAVSMAGSYGWGGYILQRHFYISQWGQVLAYKRLSISKLGQK